ncbi:hypothetical protein [Aureimonas phyllosphaerae]|uniref:Uncharacterized protein n=1 Tax=Aureimonas phyllosphaerae TaxID=1166078 RepID=A0A7W6FWA8_9HYPH|nr:hypothetical protein [Aureimonas phyllosphaerae]MBB3937695.1 hypothetical protein [Aureimonas phyllosphaerae]MBB3961770.1 hypothetical protein [Aureimonas phyllosphaerae]SFF45160.1 hypothetical protein SAMN05216566_11433 [Aureimonas phyllosphaerae]
MTLDRALEIVKAINQRSFLPMGLIEPKDVGSLAGVSLAEMLEAVACCQQETERRREHAREHGGSYGVIAVPADRLIAAAYALENYEPDGDAIVASPLGGWRGGIRVLGIVGQKLGSEADE